MCGIAGIYERDKNNKPLMDQMLDLIGHRGPDASTSINLSNVTLGHRRLAIIDLKSGDQPMFNKDRSMCIIFNGEIYNYVEIRNELISEGVSFQTNSDTEVLLKSYEHYGTAALERLNGIFAFALYDIRKDRLILVRDHFGIKPLHYYYKDGMLVFASEQKAILLHPAYDRRLDEQSVHYHLNLRYTPGEHTLFKGIKRLKPGHFLIFEQGRIHTSPYWQLKPNIDPSMSFSEATEGLHFHLKNAVRRQLVSDVPVGVYLSGGLDSSAIVQKMAEIGVPEIQTFTLGFNEPTDEFPDAAQIARQFETNTPGKQPSI